jgi:hypothetical protein
MPYKEATTGAHRASGLLHGGRGSFGPGTGSVVPADGSGAWEVRLQWLVAPVGSLIILVGLVLYGAATLQARVLARWCGLGLIVVPPIAFYMHSRIFYGSLALFGVLWVALGYVLWLRSGTPTEQPSRVR